MILPQVLALQEALSAANSASSKRASLAATGASGTSAPPATAAGDVAGVAAAITTGNADASNREIVGAGKKAGTPDQGGEALALMAKELEQARKELENLREREKDARGEADRVAASVARVRCCMLQQ